MAEVEASSKNLRRLPECNIQFQMILFESLSHSYFSNGITTLYNVCAVLWGCSVLWGCPVPWGDIMSTVGDILSTVGVFSTVGRYHDKCGGIS